MALKSLNTHKSCFTFILILFNLSSYKSNDRF